MFQYNLFTVAMNLGNLEYSGNFLNWKTPGKLGNCQRILCNFRKNMQQTK